MLSLSCLGVLPAGSVAKRAEGVIPRGAPDGVDHFTGYRLGSYGKMGRRIDRHTHGGRRFSPQRIRDPGDHAGARVFSRASPDFRTGGPW